MSLVPGAETAISVSDAGSRCTIRGTDHADRLVGTAHADVICGFGGRDVIFGGGGKDAIYAGGGDDTIYGGAGNDRIVAGPGADFVDGGAGVDRIVLGASDDLAVARGRRDRVEGGAGWDRARAASGNRRVHVEQVFGDPPADASVLLAAGDIATCRSFGDEKTAALLDAFPEARVLTLGDEAYPSGTAKDFANCYAPSWGRAKARTEPVPGNHEYQTAAAGPYFAYFGKKAAPPGGYYSFDLSGWHVIALNSNCRDVGGCQPGSAEYQWLANDLAQHHSLCTLAFWHHPLFSSVHVVLKAVKPIWALLATSGADLVLNGHAHVYERFAPLAADGTADPGHGMREIIAGTGGGAHERITTPAAHSEVRNDSTFGVLRLILRPGSYTWNFVPAVGATFTDTGTQACH